MTDRQTPPTDPSADQLTARYRAAWMNARYRAAGSLERYRYERKLCHSADVRASKAIRGQLAAEHKRDEALAELDRLRAELAGARAGLDRVQEILKATRTVAAEDPATCESCGHLESAHDPNGDRDCHASGARIRQCTCCYFIACYPEPAPAARPSA